MNHTVELEDESIKAITILFPNEMFRVRREDGKDRGIDLVISLKDRVGAIVYDTEMRAHAQVKSSEQVARREDSAFNKCRRLSDGTLAYPVPTRNLNLLLDTHCPIYILYIHSLKSLYYAWAWEECHRIENAGTDWKNQEEVIFHFTKRLDNKALKEIAGRIKREATVLRSFNDRITRNSDQAKVTVHIDLKSGRVDDPREARRILLKYGGHLVEHGVFKEVLDLIEMLDSQDRKLPKILLVRAFAEYSRSRYAHAIGHIQDALSDDQSVSDEERLNENDQTFLEQLSSACDFHTGVIDIEEYNKRQGKFFHHKDSEFSLSRRIEYFRIAYLNEEDDAKKDTLIVNLRSEIKRADKLTNTSEGFKIMARTALLLVEGASLSRFLSDCLGHIDITLGTRRLPNFGQINSQINASCSEWIKKANSLVKDASVVSVRS